MTKLFKPVENTVGKGEIARYEQFLLSPQCFQKACFPGASKGVSVWEWVKDCEKFWPMSGSIRFTNALSPFSKSKVHICLKRLWVLSRNCFPSSVKKKTSLRVSGHPFSLWQKAILRAFRWVSATVF